MTDAQRALLMASTFPVPLDARRVEAAARALLAAEGAAAFPWAGAPWA
jgi:hypothetical protein